MDLDDMISKSLGWVGNLWDGYGWKLLIFPFLALVGYMLFKGDL